MTKTLSWEVGQDISDIRGVIVLWIFLFAQYYVTDGATSMAWMTCLLRPVYLKT